MTTRNDQWPRTVARRNTSPPTVVCRKGCCLTVSISVRRESFIKGHSSLAWLAVVHNESVNEGSLTTVLSYLTAGLLWAFAVVVGCMTERRRFSS